MRFSECDMKRKSILGQCVTKLGQNGINLAVSTLEKFELSVRHDQKIFQQFSTHDNSTVYQHLAKVNAGKENLNV